MLETPTWTLGKVTPALCPKCSNPALYRSHTTSRIEEKRKQLGRKRPYRCHDCDWRGWLVDAEIRYATDEMKKKSRAAIQHDVDVPDISLDGADTAVRDRHSLQDDSLQGDLPDLREAHHQPADGGAVNVGSAVSDDAGMNAPDPGGGDAGDGDTAGNESLPEFDESAAKPVSRKVPPGFHHQSRHTVQVCPTCGDPSLYRSRSRGAVEFLRKKFTNRRPYRCHRCGWRGWLSKGF